MGPEIKPWGSSSNPEKPQGQRPAMKKLYLFCHLGTEGFKNRICKPFLFFWREDRSNPHGRTATSCICLQRCRFGVALTCWTASENVHEIITKTRGGEVRAGVTQRHTATGAPQHPQRYARMASRSRRWISRMTSSCTEGASRCSGARSSLVGGHPRLNQHTVYLPRRKAAHENFCHPLQTAQ